MFIEKRVDLNNEIKIKWHKYYQTHNDVNKSINQIWKEFIEKELK